jgi:hypothetical protein
VAGAIIGGFVYRSRNAKKKVQIEAAQLKERTDREAEDVYNNKARELEDMINRRGISGLGNMKLDSQGIQYMRDDFRDLAKGFDIQAYAKDKFDKLTSEEIRDFKTTQADHLLEAGEDILTDEERKFVEIKYKGAWSHREVMNKPGFEKYAMDRYVLTNAERLLDMDGKDLNSFMMGEGNKFVRGDYALSQFIGDGKRDLERKTEDYFKSELVNVEKSVMDDVEIDIEKSAAQAAKELEVKVEAKVEEAVVRETDRVEGAIKGVEEAVESDII